MNTNEILRLLTLEKSDALRGGAPPDYIHGLERAISIIRIMVRREAA